MSGSKIAQKYRCEGRGLNNFRGTLYVPFEMVRILSVLALALLVVAAPARAWVAHDGSVVAVKTATPPALDASLTDPVWKTALKLDNFYNFTGKGPAKLATTAYILYDDKNVYVGVEVKQAGLPIVATQTVDNAGVSTDDHISFNIDTAGNGSHVYQFRANPKGIHDEFSSENVRYAPDWTSLAKIFPNGDYNLLFVIPIAVIRGDGAAQQWRMDVVRFIASTNDEYTWAYDPTMNNVGSSQYWPYMTGIVLPANATRPKAHADIYGLASGGSDRRQFQNGVGNFQDTKPRNIGLDLTVPLTNTISFVGTINPDFSNIEQDQTTIAPQEFQRQYSEYRPFFSQGAQYLTPVPGININSYQTLLYTPAIGIFNHGEKVEGTFGESSIGVLNVGGDAFSDQAFGYGYNKSDSSLTFGVSGVTTKQDAFNDDAYEYGIATTNPHSGFLAVANYNTDRGTGVTDPSLANSYGIGAGIQNARWVALALYKDTGPQFAPALGYVQLADARGPQATLQYSNSGKQGTFLKSYQITLAGDRFLDYSGAIRETDVDGGVSATFRNNISLNVGADEGQLGGGGAIGPYRMTAVSAGYLDGTPSPTDVNYAWGPYGNTYLQQLSASAARQFGVYGLSAEYDGSIQHRAAFSTPGTPDLDTQWLRRFSFTRSFGKDASLAIGWRDITGTGGYATPGGNLAISFHKRFANLNELFFDYGTPAANNTLNRWLVKYVLHFGGATGT